MEIKDRTGLVISVYSVKQSRLLKKYGVIDYVSKRMHYVVMYVDADDAHNKIATLQKLKFVRRVELSPLVQLSTSFSNNQSLDDDDE
ncbi:YlbG family protein [Nicoliella lavandulae]|uniref:YlbG family protein n=1 Tax=Nicoliella lavandulae TaxID=3082954 RepID=A0ABU8SLL2_9LACO